MPGTTAQIIPQPIRALYKIIRILPLLSWGISSSLVGLGFAYSLNKQIRFFDYFLLIFIIMLVHGIISHAYNDREDWLSGTDKLSPGILSGGSGVVPENLYDLKQLSSLGLSALMLTFIAAIYFLFRVGPIFLLMIMIGIGAAITYSCAPFRFAYHPLAGEWLCGFPAVFTCAAGTCYVLTGKISITVVVAAAIQGLFAIGLLMHHHLSDISSDLKANPRKLTTVALVEITFGAALTPLVEFVYFLMALIIAVAGAYLLNPVFWISVSTALLCMGAALNTNSKNIFNITTREYLLYALIITDAVIKTTFLFLYSG